MPSRLTTVRQAVESSSLSSAEVSRLEQQLRSTKDALEDSKNELDRLKASASGSEKDKALVQQQLNAELAQLKYVCICVCVHVCNKAFLHRFVFTPNIH